MWTASPPTSSSFSPWQRAGARKRAGACPLYGLANNGFVEGRQNEPALLQLQAWCQRAGLPWGGGVGIGGGTMLLALRIVFPILLAVTLAGILVSLLESGQVPAGLWRALAEQALIGLFLFSGALCCLGRLPGPSAGGRPPRPATPG